MAWSKCFGASIAASRARASMSAPVYPSVSSDSFSINFFLLSIGMFFVWMSKICNLPALSGTVT